MILGRVARLLDVCERLIDHKVQQHKADMAPGDLVKLGRAKSRIMGAKAGIKETNDYFKQKGITR